MLVWFRRIQIENRILANDLLFSGICHKGNLRWEYSTKKVQSILRDQLWDFQLPNMIRTTGPSFSSQSPSTFNEICFFIVYKSDWVMNVYSSRNWIKNSSSNCEQSVKLRFWSVQSFHCLTPRTLGTICGANNNEFNKLTSNWTQYFPYKIVTQTINTHYWCNWKREKRKAERNSIQSHLCNSLLCMSVLRCSEVLFSASEQIVFNTRISSEKSF